VELSRDKDCPICGKKRAALIVTMKKNSTLKDMISELQTEGIDLPDSVLITKALEGTVIMVPNQSPQDKKLSDLPIQNHDILRATYSHTKENGKIEGRQIEFIVEMEG
jgi:hypothetical protein